MKIYVVFMVIASLVLMGCSSGTETQPVKSADVATAPGENTGTVIKDTVSSTTTFCKPGSSYAYSEGSNSVDATIIGLETYSGKQLCKATAVSVVQSPVGDITNNVVYYFNTDGKDVYVKTTTTGAMLPAPQVTEVHVVDGKVVS